MVAHKCQPIRPKTGHTTPQPHYNHTTLLFSWCDTTLHLKCSVVWLRCGCGVVCPVFGRRLAVLAPVDHHSLGSAVSSPVASGAKLQPAQLLMHLKLLRSTDCKTQHPKSQRKFQNFSLIFARIQTTEDVTTAIP